MDENENRRLIEDLDGFTRKLEEDTRNFVDRMPDVAGRGGTDQPGDAVPDGGPSPPAPRKDPVRAPRQGFFPLSDDAPSRPDGAGPDPRRSEQIRISFYNAERGLGRLDALVGLRDPDRLRLVRRWRAYRMRREVAGAVRLMGHDCDPGHVARLADPDLAWTHGRRPDDRQADWHVMSLSLGLAKAFTMPVELNQNNLYRIVRAVTFGGESLAGAKLDDWQPPGWSFAEAERVLDLLVPDQPCLFGAGRRLRNLMTARPFPPDSLALSLCLAADIVARSTETVPLPFLLSELARRAGAIGQAFASDSGWDLLFAECCRSGLRRAEIGMGEVALNGAQAESLVHAERDRTGPADIVDFIYDRPVFTTSMLAKAIGVSDRAARDIVSRIAEAGLIRRQARAHGLAVWTAPRLV